MTALAQPTTTVEPATRRDWIGLIVICSGILLVSIDGTVLNVALPTLVHDLHPSSSGLQWIVDGYTLTNAVLIMFGGALGDRYGRRRLFLLGLAGFGSASLMCAVIHSTGLLITARVLMGLAAALMLPASLSTITSTFHGAQRAKAIGLWAGVSGIGSAAGPIVGGWLLQHFWWGSVFLINVPICAVSIVLGVIVIRESRAPARPRLDPISVVLSSVGLGAVTYAVIEAPVDHWGSVTVLGSIAAAVVLLAVFVRRDRRQISPYVDLTLFRNRVFSTSMAAISVTFFALFAISFLNSQLLQFVQGNDPLGVGLRFVPGALTTIVVSNLSPAFTARFGLRRSMLVGMVLFIGALGTLLSVDAQSSYLPLGIAFTFMGGAMGFIVPASSNAMMSTIPPAKLGAGSGLRSSVQLLGGSFGVAVLGSLVTSRYRSHVHAAFTGSLRDLPVRARGAVSDQIGAAAQVIPHLPPALAARTTQVTDDAFISGMHLSAGVGVVLMVLATGAAARWIPREAPHP